MKNRSLYLLLIIMALASALCSCNDEIFIERLKVTTELAEIGPDKRKVVIGVSGKEWELTDVSYYGDEGICYPVHEGDVYKLHTAYTDLTISVSEKSITVSLESYLGNNPGDLYFTVTDGYEWIDVKIDVFPTGSYEVEIVDVSYVTDSWRGYPGEDFERKIIGYSFPEGLSEPMSFTFPRPNHLPVLYRFEPHPEADIFTKRVLNSGIEVPVPAYGSFTDKPWESWVLTGLMAELTTNRSTFDTPYIPPLPPAVELPAGQPLAVDLLCEFESIGLYCTVKAVNPSTGKIETIECELRMIMPMKLKTEIVYP